MTGKQENEHTPVPWYAWKITGSEQTVIATRPPKRNESLILYSFPEEVLGISEWIRIKQEDLEFIIKAVNEYDQDKQAIKELVECLKIIPPGKLRFLAKWTEMKSHYGEVESDLNELANAAEKLLSKYSPEKE